MFLFYMCFITNELKDSHSEILICNLDSSSARNMRIFPVLTLYVSTLIIFANEWIINALSITAFENSVLSHIFYDFQIISYYLNIFLNLTKSFYIVLDLCLANNAC